MAKQTTTQIILASLKNLREYNVTIASAERILADKAYEKDTSLLTTMNVHLRMARENRDSCVGKIFRRVQDHVGSDEKALSAFVGKIFPSLATPVVPVVPEVPKS